MTLKEKIAFTSLCFLIMFLFTFWYCGTYLSGNLSENELHWFIPVGRFIFSIYGVFAIIYCMLFCFNYLMMSEETKAVGE